MTNIVIIFSYIHKYMYIHTNIMTILVIYNVCIHTYTYTHRQPILCRN